jgi:hypothetical protein
MKTRTSLLGAATALCFAAVMGAAPATAAPAAAPTSAAAVMPAVAHTALPEVTGVDENGNAFTGTVSDLRAVTDRASGVVNLTGTISYLLDGQMVSEDFTAAITGGSTMDSQPGGCQILFLDVGPIFLDLLGLEVSLDPIVLDITAVPGAGNLLGNLLCAVAGLLDGPGNPLNAITNLLNRLLGGLGLLA